MENFHDLTDSHQCLNIAKHIKLLGHNICVLDELARECPFEINQGAGWEAQMWLISTQIRKELKLSRIYDYVIADRSIVDAVAYGNVLNLLKEDDFSLVKNVVEKTYKKI